MGKESLVAFLNVKGQLNTRISDKTQGAPGSMKHHLKEPL